MLLLFILSTVGFTPIFSMALYSFLQNCLYGIYAISRDQLIAVSRNNVCRENQWFAPVCYYVLTAPESR